jgi:hypothetical protein
MASAIERQLIVFDFDWRVLLWVPDHRTHLPVYRSLADQDSDRWVLEVLAPDLRRKMKTQKEEVQWTDLVYVVLTRAAFSLNGAVKSAGLARTSWTRDQEGADRGGSLDDAFRASTSHAA